jgi:tetratricopeptide (TPR) repeat protein
MSFLDFSYRHRHSWGEYLDQQYLKENMNVVVAKNVREAVGSIEDIYKNDADRIGANLIDIQYSIDESNENLECISFQLEKIENTLDVLNSNIVSGFQALFVKLDELDASLAHIGRGIDTLVEITRTPIQTWSFNLYENARDAMRRKLFPEALDAIRIAINGNEFQPGYKTDYRFHHLVGVLLLGIPGEPESHALVDLNSAEQAFLLAARYAHHDNKPEAAQALVGAGKTAYAKGQLPDAHKYYLDALKCDPRCGEAYYQLARLSVDANAVDSIRHFLCEAFNIHWSFAMRASSDAQFSHLHRLVEECVHKTAERIANNVMPALNSSQSQLNYLLSKQDDAIIVTELDRFRTVRSEVDKYVGEAESRKLKPVFEVRTEIVNLPDNLKNVASEYCQKLKLHERVIVSRGVTESPHGNPEKISDVVATWMAVVSIVGWAVICYFSNRRDINTFWFDVVGMFLIAGIIAGPVIAAIVTATKFVVKQFATEIIDGNIRSERAINESITTENRKALNRKLEEIKLFFSLP